MHIAATNPMYLAVADIDQEVLDKEAKIYRAQALEEGKPENIEMCIRDSICTLSITKRARQEIRSFKMNENRRFAVQPRTICAINKYVELRP